VARKFILHSGIKGYIRPHWELLRETGERRGKEPLFERIKKGAIEEAGVVVAFPALPPAWAPGRFFALFPVGEGNVFEWKEVTKQVEHDLEAGLEECPDHLRAQYREIAEATQ